MYLSINFILLPSARNRNFIVIPKTSLSFQVSRRYFFLLKCYRLCGSVNRKYCWTVKQMRWTTRTAEYFPVSSHTYTHAPNATNSKCSAYTVISGPAKPPGVRTSTRGPLPFFLHFFFGLVLKRVAQGRTDTAGVRETLESTDLLFTKEQTHV